MDGNIAKEHGALEAGQLHIYDQVTRSKGSGKCFDPIGKQFAKH